jgi:hypothetical protein
MLVGLLVAHTLSKGIGIILVSDYKEDIRLLQ